MKAIITVGISASGKTTWANDFANKNPGIGMVVSRDDIRREILAEKLGGGFGHGVLWKKWKWKWEDEVTSRFWKLVKFQAENGYDVICADTNLSFKTRTAVIESLMRMGYVVEIKEFPITLEEAWKRDAGRPDGVGHDIIYKQMEQWNEYIGRKKYVADVTKPTAMIFDVDGTLAHMNGGRGAFEWDKVEQDSLDVVVATMFRAFRDARYKMIVMSGRDGVCRGKTANWLLDNEIIYDELYMRAAGDMRKDAEIKEELFWAHVADRFNVIAVVDDRPVMCRRWIELGMKVINVGNPYKEF